MLEYSILKSLVKDKTIYTSYYKYIKDISLEKELITILKTIDNYYTEYPEHTYISKDELINYFNYLYPILKDKQIYLDIINNIYNIDTSDSLTSSLIKQLIEKDYVNKIIQLGIPILQGENKGVLTEMGILLKEAEAAIQLSSQPEESVFVDDSLEELLDSSDDSVGLRWRLKVCNEALGPLQGGTLGHCFSRPDSGKTTFIISELAYFARQLADTDKKILWILNEEKATRLKKRLYCAIVGASEEKIRQNIFKAKELFEKHGGNNILIRYNPSIDILEVEELIKTYNPVLCVIDQGDKVAIKASKKESETQILQKLYQEFRRIGSTYNVDIITVGQCGAEGEGKKWLRQAWMNNSKTGKSGELDWALGIGKDLDAADTDDRRYFYFCKNKLKNGQHLKDVVLIDTAIARYKDIQ